MAWELTDLSRGDLFDKDSVFSLYLISVWCRVYGQNVWSDSHTKKMYSKLQY